MAIEDADQLKAWLAGKPRDVSVAIAFRAAVRAVPFLSKLDWANEHSLELIKFVFRCNLVTYCFCFQKYKKAADADDANAHFEEAYRAAANAHFEEAYRAAAYTYADAAAAYAAYAAADDAAAASYATAAANADDYADDATVFWKQLNLDIQVLKKERFATALLAQPLWNISHHDAMQAHWDEMKSNLSAKAENWQFWIDYYEHLLKGGAPSQDYLNLLADIARMENEIWDNNAAQVNEIIAEKYETYKERQRSKAGEMTGAADKMNNLKANVNMWMTFPTDTAKTANFVADKIDAAINTIRQETNETEGIELFEKISEKVRCHAKILENDEISKDKRIEALEAENAELNKKIAELIAKLESDAPLEVKQTLLKIFDTSTTEIAQKAGATIGAISPIAGLYFFLGDPAVFTAIMGAAAAMRLGKSK